MAATLKPPPACRWLVRPGDRPHHCGCVKVGDAWYFVEPLFEDDFALQLVLAGFRFHSLETEAAHDIDLRWRTCDCGDFVWRKSKYGGLCKHLAALRGAGL